VPAEKWYTSAVKWAAANSIIVGYGNGKFGPDDNITREQMAAILNNYTNFTGMDLRETGQTIIFNDDAKIAPYAKEAIDRLVRAGIINGKPGNIYDPKGNATRAEYASMLERYLTLV